MTPNEAGKLWSKLRDARERAEKYRRLASQAEEEAKRTGRRLRNHALDLSVVSLANGDTQRITPYAQQGPQTMSAADRFLTDVEDGTATVAEDSQGRPYLYGLGDAYGEHLHLPLTDGD